MFKNEKLELIALKRGKKGSTLFSRTEEVNTGIYVIEPIDPTSAGDSFDAGLLCGLLEGKSLAECAKIATAGGFTKYRGIRSHGRKHIC